MFSPQGPQWSRHSVARVRHHGDRPPSREKIWYMVYLWQIWRDNEFLSLISEKFEWESPPSILVTKNPNWSQRSGTETGCIKGRY